MDPEDIETHKEYLKSHVDADHILIDHEDNCGHCHHSKCMIEAAKTMLEKEDYDLDHYWDEVTRLWRESKYYQLWQEETKAGRDPNVAFKERGWEK